MIPVRVVRGHTIYDLHDLVASVDCRVMQGYSACNVNPLLTH